MHKFLADQRILVVEDEMMVLMLLEDILADFGCASVVSAATVEQALALIRTQVFDFVLLDINLNGTMSFPVADAPVNLGVPFVFSTGYDESVTDGYHDRPMVTKPYRLEELASVFKSLDLFEPEPRVKAH